MLSGWLTACDYDIVVEPLERVGGSPINKVAVNVWEFVSRFSPRWKIAFFFLVVVEYVGNFESKV